MKCLFPLTIRAPDSIVTRYRLFKLGMIASPQSKVMQVPCGKCLYCLSRRSLDWQIRLKEELRHSSSAWFITLTYADGCRPLNKSGIECVSKLDVQRWMKRLRKAVFPAKVRYFLISEYSPTNHHPHYHLILFNFPSDKDIYNIVVKTWRFGFVMADAVNNNRIAYVANYCLGPFMGNVPEGASKNFTLMSRRPAIGNAYLTDKMAKYHHDGVKVYYRENGKKTHLPRYYRDRLFTSSEIIRASELYNSNDFSNGTSTDDIQKCYKEEMDAMSIYERDLKKSFEHYKHKLLK